MNFKVLIATFVEFLKTHQALLKILSLSSLLAFLVTPLIVILIIIKLPADYFAHPEGRKSRIRSQYPLAYPVFLTVKNLLGLALLLMGFIMIFTPGQGFLTILIGLMLINFPGKYRLKRLLLSRPGVRERINKLRERFHQPPLQL